MLRQKRDMTTASQNAHVQRRLHVGLDAVYVESLLSSWYASGAGAAEVDECSFFESVDAARDRMSARSTTAGTDDARHRRDDAVLDRNVDDY
jgi:hypothetical protein